MNAPRYRAVLTGAGGGIGAAIAAALAPMCEILLLVGRDAARLSKLQRELARSGARSRGGRRRPHDGFRAAKRWSRAAVGTPGGVDLLINNAGTSEFAWLADQSDGALERILQINAIAPMQLTRRLLPLLQAQPAATHRERRIDLRLPRLSRLRRLQREQVRAPRLHRSAATRARGRAGAVSRTSRRGPRAPR